MGRGQKWYRKQGIQKLICTTRGHELKGWGMLRVVEQGADKEGKIGKTVIA